MKKAQIKEALSEGHTLIGFPEEGEETLLVKCPEEYLDEHLHTVEYQLIFPDTFETFEHRIPFNEFMKRYFEFDFEIYES